jgi:hypothetical protein
VEWRFDVAGKQLDTVLAAMKQRTPRAASPPSSFRELTTSIPDPFDLNYRIIDQAIPRKLFAEADPDRRKDEGKPCTTAIMELFSDTTARTKLAFRTYARLRVLEPKMIQWPGG